MDINLLVKISARAWSLRILALLHQGVPGRQAALLAQTEAGRTAFNQSLQHLITLDLLERNPGHGHPLRPEYRLTPDGIKAAALAHKIENAVPGSTQSPLLRRSWSLPLLGVSHDPQSFSQLRAQLPQITDRALSQSIKRFEAEAWLARQTEAAARPTYQTIGAGRHISSAITAHL